MKRTIYIETYSDMVIVKNMGIDTKNMKLFVTPGGTRHFWYVETELDFDVANELRSKGIGIV
jgi:hypothetical protein